METTFAPAFGQASRQRATTSAIRGAVTGAVCAAVAVLAGSAQASVVVEASEPYPPWHGPEFAGGGVAYVPSHPRAGGALHVRRAAAGERRDLAVVTPPPRPAGLYPAAEPASTIDLAASAGAVALEVRTTFGAPRDPSPRTPYLQGFGGPPGGPLHARSALCGTDPQRDSSSVGAAADGSRIAIVGPGCGEAQVLDVSTGERWPLPAAARTVALAGDYVAWLESGNASVPPVDVVVARLDGTEVMRTFAADLALIHAELAVDADGTVALTGRFSDGAEPASVAVASPANPQLRRVSLPPGSEVDTARLAGGRLAVLTRAGQVVTLASADGSDLRVAATAVPPGGGLGFNGRHIATLGRRCRAVPIVRIEASGRTENVSRVATCPLRLTRRPRLTRWGLQVRLSCRGFDVNCGADRVTVRLGPRDGPVLARARHPGRGDPIFTLPLTRRERARVRAARRLTLTVAISDAPGAPALPPRTGTFRLRP